MLDDDPAFGCVRLHAEFMTLHSHPARTLVPILPKHCEAIQGRALPV